MSHHLESPIAWQDWYVFRDITQVTIAGLSTGGGEVVRYIARHGQNPRRPRGLCTTYADVVNQELPAILRT